jgi:hypothetical protein
MTAGGRLGGAAAGFGLAGALASWNPIAAPFALLVGLAAGALSVRALRRDGWRPVPAVALALSLLAVGVSGVVLALTAGVGRDPIGDAVVAGPSRDEASRTLDAAAERTGAARTRARAELSGAEGEPPPPSPRRGDPSR